MLLCKSVLQLNHFLNTVEKLVNFMQAMRFQHVR